MKQQQFPNPTSTRSEKGNIGYKGELIYSNLLSSIERTEVTVRIGKRQSIMYGAYNRIDGSRPIHLDR